jgi:TonB family protein
MNAHARYACCSLVVCLTLGAGQVLAQDSLVKVRELYASASYEDVLSMLGRLGQTPPPVPRFELERYRVFSLIALGRAAEASQVIDRIILEDPLYLPDLADTPPRVTAAFHEARRRMLSDIVKKRYVDAKASFDRKDFATAAGELELVVRMVDDPDSGKSPALVDLRMLATGFLALSNAAQLPPPVPPAAPVPTATVAAVQRVEPPPLAPPAPAAEMVIIPPVPLLQTLPRWPSGETPSRARLTGVLRLTIDEQGDVESALLVKPVHPLYDRVLLRAARSWKYDPAKQGGKPIKYFKTIEVALEP